MISGGSSQMNELVTAFRRTNLSALLSVVLIGFAPCDVWGNQDVTLRRVDRWWVADSPNFSVWVTSNAEEACATAGRCEKWCQRLREDFHGRCERPPQSPRCVVVVHDRSTDYCRAVRQKAAGSTGCTTTATEKGRLTFCRVDLRGDLGSWRENALPHELTHVVVAELGTRSTVPDWLNEGLAMLVESDPLRHRRKEVLRAAWKSGRLPSIRQILEDDRNPEGVSLNLKYAARASILQYLEMKDDFPTLVRFAKACAEGGCDDALKSIYGVNGGIEELEREWLDSLTVEFASAPLSLRSPVTVKSESSGTKTDWNSEI